MAISIHSLLEKYTSLVEFHSGARDASFEQIQDPAQATLGDLVFVDDARYLPAILRSTAEIVVINKNLKDHILESKKTILLSPNVFLLMARILKDHFPVPALRETIGPKNIHDSAVIAASANIASTAKIGPFVIVGEQVKIGEGTIIGGHCHIQRDSVIGRDCHLHAHVFIGHGSVLGDRVEIQPQSTVGTDGFGYAHDEKGRHERIHHYGRAVLENDVHLGAGVHVDRGTFRDTVIGEGTKVDNNCHFGHNTTVGKHCLFAGGLLMAGSSSVGNHVTVGGSVNISGKTHLSDGVQIAGFTTIAKNIEVKGAYQGYPVQPLLDHKRTVAALLTLPQLRKDVIKILRKLNLKD